MTYLELATFGIAAVALIPFSVQLLVLSNKRPDAANENCASPSGEAPVLTGAGQPADAGFSADARPIRRA